MWFGMLGSLEVEHDGSALDLRGSRLRRLLAVLLVHANEVVSEDRLVDAVWAGDEPATGARALRVNVSRLRKVLDVAPMGAARLETAPPGYVLRVDGCELDAALFEQMLADARRRAGAGDASGAAAILDEALGLWRGPALAEFADEDWARPEVVRLAELQATAAEERVRAHVECGRLGDALADALRLADRHPTREQPRALAMTALYRAGRQADALRVYQDYRRYLGEELGLEPSPELAGLEARIVAQDPALRSPDPPRRALRGYRLLDRIGQSPWATVHRARQPGAAREVAVKVIDGARARDPEFVRRFAFEAQAVARLEHPHVVPILDYWRDREGAYLVMPLMRGGNASDAAARGPMDLDAVARVVEEVGSALADLHRRGVFHGNLSPGNVLFDEDGHAYVSDFATLRGPGAPRGRWAPGDLPGAAADQYALAYLARFLLGGEADQDSGVPAPVASVIRRALAPEPGDRFATVAAFVEAFVASGPTRPDPGAHPPAPIDARNPYKGLRAFFEADAADFFGRERFTADLVRMLARPGTAGRFLAVVGASGSGKSSAVRAGLVPAVRGGTLPGSERWFVVTMLPGADPFGELEAALLRIAVTPPATLAGQLGAGSEGIARAVKRVLPEDDSELLLVIDQFEELYALVEDSSVRDRFLDAIVAAVHDPHARVRIVITLRADFFDRPLRRRGLADLVARAHVPIVPMDGDEIERAVSGPANGVGIAVEAGLVTRIVAELVDGTAPLPLLQYALSELFDNRRGDTLTVEDYASIGGVTGALARRAESIFDGFSPAEQAACRAIFGRLVAPGDGAPDTRRRASRRELLAAGPERDAETVIDRLGAARLLTFDRDPESREPTVEIAHEALLTRWPRVREWIDDDREGLRILRHLTSTAIAWDALGRDPGELYRGSRLAAATEWADAHPDRLTVLEADFLRASRQARADEEEAQRAHAALQARQNRRLRRALVAVGVTLVVALAAGLVALQQRDRASSQRDLAEGQREAAVAAQVESEIAEARAEREATAATARGRAGEAVSLAGQDVGRALEAALDAYGLRPDLVDSRDALLHTLVAAGPAVRTIPFGDGVVATAVDRDGHLAAAAGKDGSVRVWDVATGAQVGDALAVGGEVSALAFDAPSARLAVGRDSGEIDVWDLASAERVIGPFVRWELRVSHLVFDDSGARLLSGALGPGAHVWDLVDGTVVDLPDASLVAAAGFDGEWALTADNAGILRRWDVTAGEASVLARQQIVSAVAGVELVAEGRRATAVARRPGGGEIALAYGGEVVVLVDPSGEQPLRPLAGAGRQTVELAYSADGERLAAVSSDGRTRVWRTARPDEEPVEIAAGWLGSGGPGFGGIAFDRDGRVVLVGADGVQVFDLEATAISDPADEPFGPGTGVTGVGFDPDGRLVTVSASADGVRYAGRIARWYPGSSVEQTPLTTAGVGVAVSPDGTFAAVASWQDRLVIVDLRDGSRRLAPIRGSTSPTAVAFSPDGASLAVGTRDLNGAAEVVLYSVPDFQPVASHPIEGFVQPSALVFAGGGRQIVVGATGFPAILVDLDSGSVSDLAESTPYANAVAAGADSTVFYAGSDDGLVTTTYLDDLDRRDPPIVTRGFAVRDLALSADGETLYIVSADGGLRIHDLTSGRQVGPVLFPPAVPGVERQPEASSIALSPDGTHAAVVYSDGRVLRWEVDVASWAARACALVADPGAEAAAPCASAGRAGTAPAELPSWPTDVDALVAGAMLTTPEAYAGGWIDADEGARYDPQAVEDVPACRGDLDVVFETAERDATVASKKLLLPVAGGAAYDYVVVFPDEGSARAMFDRLRDPAFRASCLEAYAAELVPGNVLHTYVGAPEVGYMHFWGAARDAPPLPTVGDDSFVLAYDQSWSEPAQLHGPERYLVATILVGRTVRVIDGFHLDENGRVVLSAEDFAGILDRLATRARDALARYDRDPSAVPSASSASGE